MIVFSRLKNLKDLLKEYDAYKSRCIIIFKYSLFALPTKDIFLWKSY